MASVDSGVETSNESNDSCIAHDPKSLDVSPIKISPGLTLMNVAMSSHPECCTVNSGSSTSASGLLDWSKEEGAVCFQKSRPPVFKFLDPPAGLQFCNLQPACGLEKGYEIIENERERRRPLRVKRLFLTRKKYNECWLGFKDERRLCCAASTNNEEQVAKLLESGVNPNCYDHLLRTPLHLAACRGFSNVVRLLLEKGANPNQRDTLDNTPLHLAACTNHVEVVTLLLKAGTDVSSNDLYGRNPLQLAQSKLKLLQRDTNNEDSLKIKAEVQKVIEMMSTFLHKKGQDSEAELLIAFQTRLTISQTKEEVETGVRDLLASLDSLNLNKSDV